MEMDCTSINTPDILQQGPSSMQFSISSENFASSSSSSDSSGASSSSSSLVNLHQGCPEPQLPQSTSTPTCMQDMDTGSDDPLLPDLVTDCPLIEVKRNDTFGRYIVARCDIPAGTVLVSEPPAAFGPDGDGCEGYEIPLCLGCCMILNDDNEENRCSRCGWPICSEKCEMSAHAHLENECAYFVENQVKFPPPEDIDIATCYKGIQILRGILLKKRSPSKFRNLMNLQATTELQCSRDFEGLDKFLGQVVGLDGTEEQPEVWTRILGILNVNSFSFMMKCETEDRSPSFGEFVFLITSLFSHSCAPNANWAIGCSPLFEMRVRATVDIQKGQMISVPYTYDHMNYGTYGRVVRQQSFHCKCPRCLDPTELGTFNSAVKCYKCAQGLLLPLNPVDLNSPWRCRGGGPSSSVQCSAEFPGDFVMLCVEALADEVENCESVEQLENFVQAHSDKTLHPNHWVLNLASNSILSQLAHKLDTLTIQQLHRFLEHCFYILGILDVLAPGSSLFRGNVLLLISRALLTKTELSIREGLVSDKASISGEMRKVYSYQKQALDFWRGDHSYTPQNETYGPEAKDLISEMNNVKNKYFTDLTESEVLQQDLL